MMWRSRRWLMQARSPLAHLFTPSLWLKGSRSRVRVRWAHAQAFRRRAYLTMARRILLPVVQTNIIIHPPAHRQIEPIEDGQFHIHLWATPRSLGMRRPQEVLKLLLHRKQWSVFSRRSRPLRAHWTLPRGGFYPSDLGEPIASSDGSSVLGEMMPNNLYLLHNLFAVENSDSSALLLFGYLLERAAHLLAVIPAAEYRARQANRLAAQQQQARARLIETGRNFSTTREHECLAHVEAAQTHVEQICHAMVGARRWLDDTLLVLDSYRALRHDVTIRAQHAFDELLALPEVQAVQTRESCLCVYTTPLVCENPRTGLCHALGRFRIEIDLDGRLDGVRWFNLTRTVTGMTKGMHAPHVGADGRSWTAGATEIFIDLIAEEAISTVASLAIQFLQFPDVESVGLEHITCWPLATQEDAT